MQRVALCVCGTFWGVWGSECAAGVFVWVWDSLVVWGIECAAGGFVVGFWRVWGVWGSESAAGGFVVAVGQFGGLGD